MNDVAGKTAEKPEERTAFESIIERIKSGTERMISTAVKLETIGTRIMGPLPKAGSGDAKDPGARLEPDGLLDMTLRTLDRLDGSLARLEAASLRLERL